MQVIDNSRACLVAHNRGLRLAVLGVYAIGCSVDGSGSGLLPPPTRQVTAIGGGMPRSNDFDTAAREIVRFDRAPGSQRPLGGRLLVWHRGHLYNPGGPIGHGRTTGHVFDISQVGVDGARLPRVAATLPGSGANGHDYFKVLGASGQELFYRDYRMPAFDEGNISYFADLSQMPQLRRYTGISPAPQFALQRDRSVQPRPWFYPYEAHFRRQGIGRNRGVLVIGNLMIQHGLNADSNASGTIRAFDIGDPYAFDATRPIAALPMPNTQYATAHHVYRHHLLLLNDIGGGKTSPGSLPRLDGQPYGLVAIDFKDVLDGGGLSLSRKYSIRDWPGRYVQFQDEFGFGGASRRGGEVWKYNFETGDKRVFQVAAGERSTDRYWLPLGHLAFGADDTAMLVLAHQKGLDRRPPTVAFHLPADDSVGQHVRSRVALVIHETLRDETVNADNIVVRPVGGAPVDGLISVSDWDVVTFAPYKRNGDRLAVDAEGRPLPGLEADTTYEVIVRAGGIRDASGNGIEQTCFCFSTGATLAAGCCGGQRLPSDDPPADSRPAEDALSIQSIDLVPPSPMPVGTTATFEAVVSGDDDRTQFHWDFGDGSPPSTSQGSAAASHRYTKAGSYNVTLSVRSVDGSQSAAVSSVLVYESVMDPAPVASAPLAILGDQLWVVNPDNDTVAQVRIRQLDRVDEIDVCARPSGIAADKQRRLWVTCRDADAIAVIDADNAQFVERVSLPHGSAPFGIVADPRTDRIYVAEQGAGRVRRFQGATLRSTGAVKVGPTPRALALDPARQRLMVSRFISNDSEGEIWSIDLERFEPSSRIVLPADTESEDQTDSARGLPNYLVGLAIDPVRPRLWYVAKKDNVFAGAFRDPDATDLSPETTVRALLGTVDVAGQRELVEERIDIDDMGQPSAVAFSPNGTHLLFTMQGNNRLFAFDAATGRAMGNVETGLAPQGVVVDPVTKRIFTKDLTGRTVTVFDGRPLLERGSDEALTEIARINTVQREAMPDEVLWGKRVFYNAADERMTLDGYMSCASCHLDGGHDGRTWDFSGRGEGLRNTISLRGGGGATRGAIHWTGNFDEIQDFEHDIRDALGGTGFIGDALLRQAGRDQPLGGRKAGLSRELDALAAYVRSLGETRRSPYRQPNGRLTADAVAGRELFRSLDCMSCHAAPHFSDSATGARHDVGSAQPHSGRRLGGPLDGFDTPTLVGLWTTAPYLHDGSAASLREVLASASPRHMSLDGLGSAQVDQLLAYLLQIEGSLSNPPAPLESVEAAPDPQVPDLSASAAQQSSSIRGGCSLGAQALPSPSLRCLALLFLFHLARRVGSSAACRRRGRARSPVARSTAGLSAPVLSADPSKNSRGEMPLCACESARFVAPDNTNSRSMTS